ncbi:MAG: Zn-dependent hydrolase [Desulfobacteraceae bacterium]|nr:MAG: Zn-dependent hydrolase [Desulfobacteraceae bacterium]
MGEKMENTDLRVNGKRLRESLEAMAEIGGTAGGGVHRLALSDEDRQARDLFMSWLKDLNLEVSIDEVGNIFGKRAGRNDALPPVMAGSHIDSQPYGGRFDGMLGVMGALEAMRTLSENAVETERSLIIANWTNEEGSRFSPAMMGSGVWTGKLARDWVYARTDVQGKTFLDALEEIGYRGKKPAAFSPVRAYFEYHIEQGPLLGKDAKKIGIPQGILGIRWCDIHLEGTANQVGPTPMEGRNDALCAAAEMILAVNALPERLGGNLVATVGEIHNRPNSRNIIPDRVRFTFDGRSWDDRKLEKAWSEVSQQFQEIARRRGCGLRLEEVWAVDHMPFDPRLVKMVAGAAEELDLSAMEMVSGAGHDAGYMSMVVPTAMVFVPSIGGRSHVEVENTTWQDCAAGADVLLRCMLKTAQEG